MSITIKAPAKINLTLDIKGRRSDGYHEISTIMHSVSLSDTVTVAVEKSAVPEIIIKTDKVHIPRGPENTVYKAAMLFMEETKIAASVSVELQKTIPVGAGLGGGSSDAAAVLKALKMLLKADLSRERLIALAACVGADVPFCVEGGCALATGIGERLVSLPVLPAVPVVICKPGGGVSTKKVFEALRAENINLRPDTGAALKAVKSGDIISLSRCCYNVLTDVTLKFKPEITAIKRELISLGALCAEMSGSGPAVFALFKENNAAKKATEVMRKKYAQCFLTSLGQ